MLSNKINKSKQARHLEVDGMNWNLEYESGIECNLQYHDWPETSTFCIFDVLKMPAGCKKLFSCSEMQI